MTPWRAGAAFAFSRVLVALTVLVMAAAAGVGAESHPLADGTWWLDRLAHWDSYHFIRVAESGYFAPDRHCCDQAYFPGYPLTLRALAPLFGGHTVAAGIVVALLSSALAAAALWGMTRDLLGDRVANRALLALAVAPYGVFLIAVYSDPFFLAAALGAWWAGRRGRWWLAAVISCVATASRVNGLFVVAGLVTMYAVAWAGRRAHGIPAGEATHSRTEPRRHHLGAALLPLAPVLGFATWLHAQTGSWDAWREAQTQGWQRRTMLPWQSMAQQVSEIAAAPSPWLGLTRTLDLAVVIAALALLLVLLWWRWWPELVFTALSVGVILTTSTYDSVGRYALSWFPAYLVLARAGEDRRGRWIWWGFLALGVILLPLLTWLFAKRQWIA